MWRLKIIVVIMLMTSVHFGAEAQNIEKILKFYGADSPEELNPYDVERLEDLLAHPLRINQVSASKLEAAGLFSNYQTASLTDYRLRHGDVLSFNELAAIDGFGEDFAARVAPFISLESAHEIGRLHRTVSRNDLSLKTALKKDKSVTYGLKYKLTVGEGITAGVAVSRTSDSRTAVPDALSGHLAWYMKRYHGKIIIGDFNARFGQGLTLWNGVSFNSLTSVSSFMRRPSGITVSSSFTGNYALRGIAGDMQVGRFRITALTAVKDLASKNTKPFSVVPAVNFSCLLRHGQVSVTHYMDFSISGISTRIPDMKTSADFAFCLKGTDLFGEVSYDWVMKSVAALCGMTSKIRDNLPVAAMLRYRPLKEYALSLASGVSAGEWVRLNGAEGFGSSVRRHVAEFSAEAVYYPVSKSKEVSRSIQLKAQAEWTVMISNAVKAEVRLSERLRTWGDPCRTDLRADFSYISRIFFFTVRLNALHCKETGLLAYAEGGYRNGKLSVYLRQGIFNIDNWADRIYVYERDAPGSFNVPAYYGRGLWSAATLNWRFARWGRFYLRAAYTVYPFADAKKPGRAELKFQFVFDL